MIMEGRRLHWRNFFFCMFDIKIIHFSHQFYFNTRKMSWIQFMPSKQYKKTRLINKCQSWPSWSHIPTARLLIFLILVIFINLISFLLSVVFIIVCITSHPQIWSLGRVFVSQVVWSVWVWRVFFLVAVTIAITRRVMVLCNFRTFRG